jgi:hypothetical protein
MTAGHGVVPLGATLTGFLTRAQLGVQAACRSDSSRRSLSPIWFQLAKIRVTTFSQYISGSSGAGMDSSCSR